MPHTLDLLQDAQDEAELDDIEAVIVLQLIDAANKPPIYFLKVYPKNNGELIEFHGDVDTILMNFSELLNKATLDSLKLQATAKLQRYVDKGFTFVECRQFDRGMADAALRERFAKAAIEFGKQKPTPRAQNSFYQPAATSHSVASSSIITSALKIWRSLKR